MVIFFLKISRIRVHEIIIENINICNFVSTGSDYLTKQMTVVYMHAYLININIIC